MQTFDWTTIKKGIAIKSDLATIYAAWTQAEELERWFLETAQYTEAGKERGRKESFIANDDYEWSWFLYEPHEFGKVVLANGKDHLQFTFAQGCLVDVKLSQQGEHTIVKLIQSNIPQDDKSKQDIRIGCASGWAFYLVNLKSIYEGGLDLRNKDAKLGVLINN